MIINLHTHTPWCDGRSSLDSMVHKASELGMRVLGFSPHAPLGFKTQWSIPDLEQTRAYCQELEKLQADQKTETQIISGLEADYIPGSTYSFDMFREQFGFQYIIGSIHMVKAGSEMWFIDGPRDGYLKGLKNIFGNDIKKAAEAFYKQSADMIRLQRPDVIGHMDKILMHNHYEFFKPTEEWHMDLVDMLLSEIKAVGCAIEINTRGVYTGKHSDFYPGQYLLGRLKKLQIPLLINSDAHHTSDLIGSYDAAADCLIKAGIQKLYYPIGETTLEVDCQQLRTIL